MRYITLQIPDDFDIASLPGDARVVADPVMLEVTGGTVESIGDLVGWYEAPGPPGIHIVRLEAISGCLRGLRVMGFDDPQYITQDRNALRTALEELYRHICPPQLTVTHVDEQRPLQLTLDHATGAVEVRLERFPAPVGVGAVTVRLCRQTGRLTVD